MQVEARRNDSAFLKTHKLPFSVFIVCFFSPFD